MAHPVPADELPVIGFHRRIAFVTGGGPFCDGYLLGIIAVALPSLTTQLSLSPLWQGLIAASALIGLFAGGFIFGPITDRLGRQHMYVINLAVFIVGSVLQFFVANSWQLFLIRLVIGLAIGADYPIATAIATEYLPRKTRGPVLTGLVVAWWIGYGISFVVGYLMNSLGGDVWRWMLVTGGVPALVFLIVRVGVPESPRWLIAAGRVDDARTIARRCFGDSVDFDALVEESRHGTRRRGSGLANIGTLFKRGYAPPLVFCSVFWICQVAPSFALRTYQPEMLKAFGVTDELGSSVLVMAFPVVGVVFGMFTVNKLGRRPLLLGTFAAITLSLLLLGVIPSGVAVLAVALFILYNMAEAAGSGLQYVYPNELFPTELRATGMGVATGMSRLGAAAGTFVLPNATAAIGVRGALFVAAGIGLVGLLVSWFMAPETTHLRLADASRTTGPLRGDASSAPRRKVTG